FQAEDGIRGFHVTGVQTCALPIFISGMTAGPAAAQPAATAVAGSGQPDGEKVVRLDLKQAVEMALANNVELALARQEVEAARVRSEERRVGNDGRWWRGAGYSKKR